MKLKKILVLLLLICPVLLYNSTGDMRELIPLLGKWQMKIQNTVITEEWKKITENTFEVSNRFVSKDKGDTTSREDIIVSKMNNKIFYMAKVEGNQYPIPFEFTGVKDSAYVFENPSHDFPKKIIYKFENANKITVTVTNGKKELYYYFERVKL